MALTIAVSDETSDRTPAEVSPYDFSAAYTMPKRRRLLYKEVIADGPHDGDRIALVSTSGTSSCCIYSIVISFARVVQDPKPFRQPELICGCS